MITTNPDAFELLHRSFTVACSAAQLANDAQKASDDGRGSESWQAWDAATNLNRVALGLLVRAAQAEVKAST